MITLLYNWIRNSHCTFRLFICNSCQYTLSDVDLIQTAPGSSMVRINRVSVFMYCEPARWADTIRELICIQIMAKNLIIVNTIIVLWTY